MQKQSFSIFKAIDFGFRMFERNIWLILGLVLMGFAVRFGANVMSNSIIHQSGLPSCFTKQKSSSIEQKTGYQIGELKYPLSISTKSVYSDSTSESNMDFTYTLDLGNFKIAYSKLEDAIEVRLGDFIHSSYKGSYTDMITCLQEHLLSVLLLLLISLLASIFAYILFMGWNRIALDIYDTGTSEIKRIFTVIPLFLTYLLCVSLYIVIVIGGLILLFIPGIMWALKYSFFDLIIFDTGCGPIEALSKSGQLTYGHKWKLLLFAVVSTLLMALSALTIILPFVLIYVFLLSRVYIYRTLQGVQTSNTQPDIS